LFAQIGNLRKQISDRAEVRDGLVPLKGAARGTFAGQKAFRLSDRESPSDLVA